MGRMKRSWYYARQAAQAEARETYYRNRVPPVNTTVTSRGAATTLYYRSLTQRNGTDPLIYRTQVDDDTLALVPATAAGLLTTLPANTFAARLRGSGVKPSTASWYEGTATPVADTTAWGTRWIRYYAATGRSHFSIPFSRPTGTFGPDDLQAAFNTVFNGAQREALLGTRNGRAQLVLERASTSVMT